MERAKMSQVKVCLEIQRFRSTRRVMGRAVWMAGASALEEAHALCSEEQVNWGKQVHLKALLLQSQ